MFDYNRPGALISKSETEDRVKIIVRYRRNEVYRKLIYLKWDFFVSLCKICRRDSGDCSVQNIIEKFFSLFYNLFTAV